MTHLVNTAILWMACTFMTLKKDLNLIPGHCHLHKERQAQRVATMLCNAGYSCIKVTGKLLLTPRLPPASSDQEPTWLKNCHQSLEDDIQHEPDEGDRNALAKVPTLSLNQQDFT